MRISCEVDCVTWVSLKHSFVVESGAGSDNPPLKLGQAIGRGQQEVLIIFRSVTSTRLGAEVSDPGAAIFPVTVTLWLRWLLSVTVLLVSSVFVPVESVMI